MVLDPWWSAALVGVLGLLIGSFLNVVIYRLPKMMERQWNAEVAAYAAERAALESTGTADDAQPQPPPAEPFNLMVPRSRCQACGHMVQWYENIPVLSYLFLRGKCSSCGVHISLRYPLVELGTAGLFAFLGHWGGLSAPTLVWCGFAAAMVALAMIDWDTTLLPDDITLPLLWAGLIASTLGWTGVPVAASVTGAAAGYLSLWLVYWGFKLLTGKEGMGYGDFKLLGALGAWCGASGIIPILLMSSVIGAIVGSVWLSLKGRDKATPIPFGPYLAAAGWVQFMWGEQIVGAYMRYAGLS